ncbi:queuosine precursor transporter [Sulfuricurvum sp.]|uniref:queuosine precursor transporter n=1 Tax=Sulfuricurvum sp. TaxID=2025608 RepID=UPI003BB568ED
MQTTNQEKSFRLLAIFTGIYVGVLVLVPSMSSKFISIGDLVIVGSTLIFPITFIFNDIFTEVYGYKRTRQIIWTGFAMQIFAAFFYWIIDIWQAPSFWTNQEAYHTILGQAPRIVLASLSAFFLGEFANSFIMSKMKYQQDGAKGVKQASRFVLSTIVGEFLDSFIFMFVAFYGVMQNSELISIVLTIWAVKVGYEVLMLPISMRIANWVKKAEGIDQIDNPNDTHYSPFSIK